MCSSHSLLLPPGGSIVVRVVPLRRAVFATARIGRSLVLQEGHSEKRHFVENHHTIYTYETLRWWGPDIATKRSLFRERSLFLKSDKVAISR